MRSANRLVTAPLALTALAAAAAAAATTSLLQKDDLGYQDTPVLPGTGWHVHDGLRPQPPVVTPGATAAQPPSDATVLFDGEDTSAFEGGPWEVEDGAMTVNGKGGLRTKESFGPVQLHLEWRSPEVPADGAPTGQGRGNSGVFFFGMYEVQILDCFENRTYPDGMTGALYGQFPPMANACRPPGEWQSYDIMFQPPIFGDDGGLQRPAIVTVMLNGVCLHHAQVMLGATQHRKVARYATHRPEGPISIQDHGNPVSFRNIWVRPLAPAE